jgi:hypothetical protein
VVLTYAVVGVALVHEAYAWQLQPLQACLRFPDQSQALHLFPIQFELFYFVCSSSYLPLPIGIDDPSRPVEGPLRVWLKVFNDSDLSLMRGYVGA